MSNFKHFGHHRRRKRRSKRGVKSDGLTSFATADQDASFVMIVIALLSIYVIGWAIFEFVVPFIIKHWFWFTIFGLPTAIWLYKKKYPAWKVQYRSWRERRSLGISKPILSNIESAEVSISTDQTEVYLQRITVNGLFTFIKVGISNNTQNRDFLKSDKPVKKEVLDMLVFDTRVAAHAYEQQLLKALRQKGKQLDIELCQVYMKNGFTECFYDGSLERLPR